MIGQYLAVTVMAGMAAVSSLVLYSNMKDSEAALSVMDAGRRMDAIAQAVAQAARIPAGQVAAFPPAGSLRNGIYSLPAGLADLDAPDGGDAFLYCPLPPVQLSGASVEMLQPSGATVTAYASDGLIVGGPLAPAMTPQPIAAVVAALPRQSLPDCSQLTYTQSAATAAGALVKLVFAQTPVDNAALRDTSLFYVSNNGSGLADGSSPTSAMPFDVALRKWYASRPRLMRLRLTQNVTNTASINSAIIDNAAAADTAAPGKLIIEAATGTTWDASPSLPNFNPAGDFVLSGVTLLGTLRLIVPPGRTSVIENSVIRYFEVSAGSRMILGPDSVVNSTLSSTPNGGPRVGGTLILAGGRFIVSRDCMTIVAGGHVSGVLNCAVTSSYQVGVSVYGKLSLDAGKNHVITNGRLLVASVGELETGYGSTLSIDPYLSSTSALDVQGRALLRGNISAPDGAYALDVANGAEVVFGGGGPALEIRARYTAYPLRFAAASKLSADRPVTLFTGLTSCISIDSQFSGHYTLVKNGDPFQVKPPINFNDRTGGEVTSGDYRSWDTGIDARDNLRRARLAQQIAFAMSCKEATGGGTPMNPAY